MKNNRYSVCPHCGEEIKENAKACYNCGSDEMTGWSENTYLDDVGIPDSDEYEELKEKEFGSRNKKTIGWITITGFTLLLISIFFLLQNVKM